MAKIAALLQGLKSQLDVRFDPKRKDSVLGRFDERLDMLVKKLAAPDGPFNAVATQLDALRVEVARTHANREGQSAIIERTAIKGGLFEDDLKEKLVALARVHGDIVERTATKPGPGGRKKGDFVVTLAGKVGTIVIEAKGGAINSLPNLANYFESAKQARSADLTIAVVKNADDIPLTAPNRPVSQRAGLRLWLDGLGVNDVARADYVHRERVAAHVVGQRVCIFAHEVCENPAPAILRKGRRRASLVGDIRVPVDAGARVREEVGGGVGSVLELKTAIDIRSDGNLC